jgi:hypothetical protein
MVTKKIMVIGLLGFGLLLAILCWLAWLFMYNEMNSVVVINESSSFLQNVIINLPEGTVQLGSIKPQNSLRHFFLAPKKDGNLSFHIIDKSRRLWGDGGQYLDGMGGEHYVITIVDGDSYNVKTRFQVSHGEQRLKLLNK